MEYVVKLQQFEGPLDLLLYLVYKNELDIFDIPISVITDQFLEYIDASTKEGKRLNPEFLFMASLLVHMKSKLLLQDPTEEELETIRTEITEPLVEYMYFKEAGARLKGLGVLFVDTFPRLPGSSLEDMLKGMEREIEVDVVRLLEAFKSVLKKGRKDTFFVTPPKWTVKEKTEELLGMGKGFSLSYLASISSCVEEFVVYFVAVLELIFEGVFSILEKGEEVEVIFNGQ